MKRWTFSIVLILLMVFAGCSSPGDGTESTASLSDLEMETQDIAAAYSARDTEKILSFMDDNVELIGPGGESILGKEEYRNALTQVFTPFPDFTMESVFVFGKGDRTCLQYRGKGTAAATQEGSEAIAGKTMSVPGAMVFEWNNGKVVRISSYIDMATVLTQLGLMPPITGQ